MKKPNNNEQFKKFGKLLTQPSKSNVVKAFRAETK